MSGGQSPQDSFTNWVKPDFYRTFDTTPKISASPRIRERYGLGVRSPCCGNCFFQVKWNLTPPTSVICVSPSLHLYAAKYRGCKTSVLRSRGTHDPTDFARFGRDARPCASALAGFASSCYVSQNDLRSPEGTSDGLLRKQSDKEC